MTTPPTAATYFGDLGTPFETSPTTRITDTLERMMAQAPDNPAAAIVPDSCGFAPQTRRRARERRRALQTPP